MSTLKIVLCIISCVCVAASVLLGVFLGWQWFFVAAGVAILSGAGMFLTKKKSDPPQAKPTDFMNSDEENAKIRKRNAELDQKDTDKK